MLGNTSGCGLHYLLRQFYTSRCISGRKVSGRSTKRTGFIGGIPIRGSDTKRGELHWGCFCKQSSLELNPTHRYSVTSFPLAYSIIVLPLTVARWLLFSHHYVSPAATFFGISMFNLSGAINVLLFLIFRRERLLFPRPKELPRPQLVIEPEPQAQDIRPAILDDAENLQNSPEPTPMELGDEDSGNGAAGSPVNPEEI